MSRQQQTFVVVGAGLAGAKAAETLREQGFAGRVVNVNVGDVNEQLRALVRSRRAVATAEPVDPDTPLDSPAGERDAGARG